MSEVIHNFEITTFVQILKYIISKHPNPKIYNVLKMLYLADKIHLLEYGELMTSDTYKKMEHGPVASICYDILKFVRGTDYNRVFDKSIKEEIKRNLNGKLEISTPPDMDYLSETNIECITKAIEQYGKYNSKELEELTHDAIYDSVDFNQEITVFHMAKELDKTGKLTEYLLENSI